MGDMLKLTSIILISAVFFYSCRNFGYSFKGSTLNPAITTFTVETFKNEANIVVPSLSNTLTEKLKDKAIKELNLKHNDKDGQIVFRGIITEYKTGPASVTSNEIAASTRLTISVRVIYENTLNPEQNYEATFSAYSDFDSKFDLSSIENQLIDQISDILIQDIFNRAVNNW